MRLHLASLSVLLVALAVPSIASADPILADSEGYQTDYYVGANDRGYLNVANEIDVIGNNRFAISGSSLKFTDKELSISIATNYVNNVGAAGTDIGDLFFDFFTDAKPYQYDDSGDKNPDIDPYYGLNDNADSVDSTKWSYGLRLNGDLRADPGGTADLVEITNYGTQVLTSDDLGISGTFREGQEVKVTGDATSLANGMSASWDINDVQNLLNFKITADQGGLIDLFGLTSEYNAIGYHWAMTCGNDTVEGTTDMNIPPSSTLPVPEPTSMALFGLGILGLGFTRRRQRS